MANRRKWHTPEQVVQKLRDADAMVNAVQDLAVVLQAPLDQGSGPHRWRSQFGGMKSEEAKQRKEVEDEIRQLRQLVVDQALDIQMLKYVNPRIW